MSVLPARARSLLRRAVAKLRRAGAPIPGRSWLRLPGEPFDAAWYLRTYPDVAASGRSPLVHYLRHGRADGRHPNERAWCLHELAAEAFDPAWYLRRYPDVERQGVDPVLHYLRHGRAEGRSPTLTHARAAAWVQSFGER